MIFSGAMLDRYLTRERSTGLVRPYSKLSANKIYGRFAMHGNALTGSELVRFANKARQRRKGPLVRFGRKP